MQRGGAWEEVSHRTPQGSVFTATRMGWGMRGIGSQIPCGKPAPPSPPPFLTTARRRAPVGELHPVFLALVATVLALRILPEKSSEKMPGTEVDGIWGLEPPFLGAQGSGRPGEGLMEPAHAARSPLANLPSGLSAPCARLPSECPRPAPAPVL